MSKIPSVQQAVVGAPDFGFQGNLSYFALMAKPIRVPCPDIPFQTVPVDKSRVSIPNKFFRNLLPTPRFHQTHHRFSMGPLPIVAVPRSRDTNHYRGSGSGPRRPGSPHSPCWRGCSTSPGGKWILLTLLTDGLDRAFRKQETPGVSF